MKRLAVVLASFGLLTACGFGSSEAIQGNNRSNSEVTSVSIGLPDRAVLKTQVPDIETKMNAYHLVVTPVDPTCGGATKIDEIGDYVATAKLGASLKQGCDYDVTLALGHLEAPTTQNPAAPVSYEKDAKPIIDGACIRCHVVGFASGDLTTYAAVKAMGDKMINRAVTLATMPAAAPLSQAERNTLQAWADGGYTEKATTTPTTTPVLTAVYYQNNQAKRISKDDIKGQAELKAALTLDLQQAGKDIGISLK